MGIRSLARHLAALTLATCCLLCAPAALAGLPKIKLTGGDLSAFTSPQAVQVVFVYEGLMVGDTPEEAYVAEKVAERNKDEASTGDDWAQRWRADREGRYQPKFLELMNRELEEAQVTLADAPATPTLIMTVRVTRIEPGFYSYMVNRPAEVDFDISVASAAAPGTEIAHLTLERAPGVSVVAMVDTGERISEAYAKAGKELAKFIRKGAK
ncbi:MAG: hypothetical protein ABIO70_26975 [Pseudomonadota bacterium]